MTTSWAQQQSLHHIQSKSIFSPFPHSFNFRLFPGHSSLWSNLNTECKSATYFLRHFYRRCIHQSCYLVLKMLWCVHFGCASVMQNCASVSNIMLIMRVKSNALQWVLVYCSIGFSDTYFKASFYTVLSCILYQKVQKKCFFLYVLSLKCNRELVAGWLTVLVS